MEYHVTWKIDIEAESFEEAARIARNIQRDPGSLATHFIVESESGRKQEVWTDEQEGDGL
jgi:spore germination protein YaaH